MDTLDLEQEDSHEDALQEQTIVDASELSVEVNAANSAVETLQKYYGLVEVAEANGGVATTTASAINIGLESIDSMFELDIDKTISMESIGDRIRQVGSMASEGMKKLLGINVVKAPETPNMIHDLKATGTQIEKYIQATYMNNSWLDQRAHVKDQVSLDGQLAVLSINTKAPGDVLKAVEDYMRAVEKFISATKSDRAKFYKEADDIFKKLGDNPSKKALKEALQKLKGMTYPLDQWMKKAPNYTNHVGGVDFEVKDNPYYSRGHYSFSIRSDAHGVIDTLSKDDVKKAAQLMLELKSHVYDRHAGMFEEVHKGMYINEPSYDAEESGLSDAEADELFRIQVTLIDKRNIDWEAIILPYATSFQKLLQALDIVIDRSLKVSEANK